MSFKDIRAALSIVCSRVPHRIPFIRATLGDSCHAFCGILSSVCNTTSKNQQVIHKLLT